MAHPPSLPLPVGSMVCPVCRIWSIVVYVCICQCLRLYTMYNIYTGQGIDGIFPIDYHLVQAHRYLCPSLSQRPPYSLNTPLWSHHCSIAQMSACTHLTLMPSACLSNEDKDVCYQFTVSTNWYILLVLPPLVYAWTSTGYEPRVAKQCIMLKGCNIR